MLVRHKWEWKPYLTGYTTIFQVDKTIYNPIFGSRCSPFKGATVSIYESSLGVFRFQLNYLPPGRTDSVSNKSYFREVKNPKDVVYIKALSLEEAKRKAPAAVRKALRIIMYQYIDDHKFMLTKLFGKNA